MQAAVGVLDHDHVVRSVVGQRELLLPFLLRRLLFLEVPGSLKVGEFSPPLLFLRHRLPQLLTPIAYPINSFGIDKGKSSINLMFLPNVLQTV